MPVRAFPIAAIFYSVALVLVLTSCALPESEQPAATNAAPVSAVAIGGRRFAVPQDKAGLSKLLKYDVAMQLNAAGKTQFKFSSLPNGSGMGLVRNFNATASDKATPVVPPVGGQPTDDGLPPVETEIPVVVADPAAPKCDPEGGPGDELCLTVCAEATAEATASAWAFAAAAAVAVCSDGSYGYGWGVGYGYAYDRDVKTVKNCVTACL